MSDIPTSSGKYIRRRIITEVVNLMKVAEIEGFTAVPQLMIGFSEPRSEEVEWGDRVGDADPMDAPWLLGRSDVAEIPRDIGGYYVPGPRVREWLKQRPESEPSTS